MIILLLLRLFPLSRLRSRSSSRSSICGTCQLAHTNAVFHIEHYSTLINHVHKAHRFIERVSTTRPAVLYLTTRGGTKLLARPYAKQYASRTRTSRRPKCHRLGPECNHSPPSKMLINGTNKHTLKSDHAKINIRST